ncbi:MAG TPA: imidazole glycerol phosphate synthase subunit HisH [Candidatus Nanoarchaeia archaeon]|nr:imidazole glycerol phosphate synthase subunit HisH [Candidatus Nanoarchaeia archaeon]
MIVILDYGAGNLKSVKNVLDKIGVGSKITDNPGDIQNADRLILPGDGSFGYLMKSLQRKKMVKPIKYFIKSGKPFLGICLGLQALFEESEESPGIKGLGVLKGKVIQFNKGKIPQIGWNTITPSKNNIFRQGYVYFVNSYYAVPEDKSVIAAMTNYYVNFASAVVYKNILAMQFHPEKSGIFGINILRRWLKC